MGIRSLASSRSSGACARCLCAFLCQPSEGVAGRRWAGCRGTDGHGPHWVAGSLRSSDGSVPSWHPRDAPQLSPAPLTEAKDFQAPSHPRAHINGLGKRNFLSQLGHLHLQGCQAPEDCNSQANIFPDIFCGCTIYSVVQSHEICRVFHGNHRDSFLLKETASNRKWDVYMDKINQFKDIRKPTTTNSAPRNAALSPWGAGVGKNVWHVSHSPGCATEKGKLRARAAKQISLLFVPHLSLHLLTSPS